MITIALGVVLGLTLFYLLVGLVLEHAEVLFTTLAALMFFGLVGLIGSSLIATFWPTITQLWNAITHASPREALACLFLFLWVVAWAAFMAWQEGD